MTFRRESPEAIRARRQAKRLAELEEEVESLKHDRDKARLMLVGIGWKAG